MSSNSPPNEPSPLVVNPISLTDEEWERRFKPIQNLFNLNRGYNGQLFETYGVEEAYVRSRDAEAPGTVWTLHDDGSIASGFHYIDRQGYFVCSVACGPDECFTVPSDDAADGGSDDRCRTDGCDGDPDCGDAWDGYCPDCADARANDEANQAEADRHIEGL